jgi:hypothetical protein
VKYVIVKCQHNDVAADNLSMLKKLDIYGQLMDD